MDELATTWWIESGWMHHVGEANKSDDVGDG